MCGQGVEIVERHLHETGRIRPERLPVPGVAGREGQPGVAVVAAGGRQHPEPAGAGARHLDRQVDGLPPAHPEDDAGQRVAGGGRQPLGEHGAVAAGQVVVADVDRVERRSHRVDHLRVTVAQVEHAAVGVAVEPAAVVVEVVERGAPPPAHHGVEPHRLEEVDLAGVDVVAERGVQ